VLLAGGVAGLFAGAPLSAQETSREATAPSAPAASTAPRTVILSLDEALRIAAGESETVWVAEAGVMSALGNRAIAHSQLFPQVSATAAYVRTLRSQFSDLNFGGGGTDGGGTDSGITDLPFGRANQYTLALSLNQLLFDGGQTLARNRAAAARLRSARIGTDSALAQALLDVTQAYFDAQLADRLVQIAESSLAQTEEVLRQTDVARRVGDRSEFELLRARVARDNQIPALIQRRTGRTESYLRLKQLLNIPLRDDLRLTTTVEETVPRFAADADPAPESRAPVRQAVENVSANEAQLAEARGQRWPAVSLSSRYSPVAYPQSGIPGFDDFREDWTVTLSLSVPLLTWGRLAGVERVAQGGLSDARARLQQTREAAELDAQVARNDLTDAQATLAASSSTSQEAGRAYEIAQLRFREGIASQIELSDSRLLLEQAEVNRALALRNVQVARARLALLADLPLNQGGFTTITGTAGQATPTQTQPQTTAATAPSDASAAGAAGTAGALTGSPIP
jgi:outer membrane protein TolC